MTSRSRYSSVAIILHWLIAAAIIFQLSFAFRMEAEKGPTGFAMYQLHKSVGLTIFVLSLARLGWRLLNPVPLAPPGQPRWERVASRIVHVGFYVIMIGMPLTGWLMVSTSRIEVPTLLFGAVPWPHIPGLQALSTAARTQLNNAGDTGHHAFIPVVAALLLLHLGAVAKHQLIDRDAVFANMAPGAKNGILEWRLWLVAAAFVALIVIGKIYTPSAQAGGAAGAPAAPPAAADVVAPNATPVVEPTAAVPPQPLGESAAPKSAVWTVERGGALGFTADWSGSAINGRFTRWTTDIVFDPEALEDARVKVTVDLSSVATGDAQRDATLPSADWFDTAAHPKAVFSAAAFRHLTGDRYVADGTLTLRGVAKPLPVRFTLAIKDDRATASGDAAIDRTLFGVGQGEFTSTDQVAARVKVHFDLKARRT